MARPRLPSAEGSWGCGGPRLIPPVPGYPWPSQAPRGDAGQSRRHCSTRQPGLGPPHHKETSREFFRVPSSWGSCNGLQTCSVPTLPCANSRLNSQTCQRVRCARVCRRAAGGPSTCPPQIESACACTPSPQPDPAQGSVPLRPGGKWPPQVPWHCRRPHPDRAALTVRGSCRRRGPHAPGRPRGAPS